MLPTEMTFITNESGQSYMGFACVLLIDGFTFIAVYFEQGNFEECIATAQRALTVGQEHGGSYENMAKACTRIANAHHKLNDLQVTHFIVVVEWFFCHMSFVCFECCMSAILFVSISCLSASLTLTLPFSMQ